MRIDSSGSLIIGTTTAATNAKVTVRASAPQLSLYATPGWASRLTLGDTDDYDIGKIEYANSDDSMRFTTNASERLRIDSSGRLLVGASSAATGGTLAQYATFVLRGDSGGSSNAGIINLARGTGAASMSSGFSAGVITFSDNAGLEFGDIGFNADGSPSGSSTPGRFVVKTTASGATTSTERMRIDSSGNMGLGNNNPQSKLQIENSGEQLRLTYPSVASYIHEVKSNGDYAIDKDGSERMRILSGGGLTFNGDTAQANALDDYEEGSCTMSLTTVGSAPTITYGNTAAYYVKVGQMVTVSWYTGSMNISNAGTGVTKILGFPFTVNSANHHYPVMSISHVTCFASIVTEGYLSTNNTEGVPIIAGSTTGVALITGIRYMMVTVTYRTN